MVVYCSFMTCDTFVGGFLNLNKSYSALKSVGPSLNSEPQPSNNLTYDDCSNGSERKESGMHGVITLRRLCTTTLEHLMIFIHAKENVKCILVKTVFKK